MKATPIDVDAELYRKQELFATALATDGVDPEDYNTVPHFEGVKRGGWLAFAVDEDNESVRVFYDPIEEMWLPFDNPPDGFQCSMP